MDDVKLLCPCHLSSYDRVVVDLLVKVSGITTGKLHGSEIVDVHIVEVGIDMVAQLEVVFRRHHVAATVFHIVIVHVAPCDGHTVHCHYATGACIFVTKRAWKAQHRLNVALGVKALADAIVCRGKTTKHMRRILPTKH